MTRIERRVHETSGPEETIALAAELGRRIAGEREPASPLLVLLLNGELGTGKTVFAKGLASGLGVKDADDVVSPTFTLVNEHPLPAGRTLYHVDLYRIGHPDECEGIGLRDILNGKNGDVAAVEWAEKLAGSAWDLTRHPWWFRVTLTDLGEDRRLITVEAGKSLEFTEDE